MNSRLSSPDSRHSFSSSNSCRVAKANTATPPVPYKLYWYGSGGEILAETDSSGNNPSEYIFFGGKRVAMLPAGSTPIYYVEDLLGTSRVTTTNAGVVCYDADFYPFGGERPPYTNTCTQNNYKFEGKERDTETGNDDFGARYYSNRFGRWLSIDWSAVPVAVPYANLTNPQTLNLYSMVSDDPESFADLDGHKCDDNTGKGCFWEKLQNKWNYDAFVTNKNLESALQKDADAARRELTNSNVQHDGQNPDEYLKGKSNKEVLDLWHEFMSSGVRGTLGVVGMLGANGAQFTSKTLWQDGKARIDVENPAPGKRPGQIHYQEGPEGARQNIYDPATRKFQGLSDEKKTRNSSAGLTYSKL